MPQASPAPVKLVLTTTSVRNVTIATASDEFYYEIVTYKWDPLHTKIRKLDPSTGQMAQIAEIKLGHERSGYTEVQFTNLSHDEGEIVFHPLEALSQVELNNDRGKVFGSFTGNDGKRYRWQKVKGSIELFCTDEPDGKSLARFHTHRRHLGVLRMSQKPYIDVDPQLSDTLDTVIVSFIIAEGKRRGL